MTTCTDQIDDSFLGSSHYVFLVDFGFICKVSGVVLDFDFGRLQYIDILFSPAPTGCRSSCSCFERRDEVVAVVTSLWAGLEFWFWEFLQKNIPYSSYDLIYR